ncbi:MAG: hypothetical protein H7315_09760 [Herminiimonas sp.]|nr:hypothetical protein [Herminiimonas sp.]
MLSLAGYVDDGGAISILHRGDTVDPYFALQALLLAHENGLDISSHAEKWAEWVMARQKPDATFDRFCRVGPVWAPCKTADADDALLALWLKFLDTMPARLQDKPAWRQSYQMSGAALRRLRDKRGIYLVSPVYQHGLFMDNLEVWSWKPARQVGRKTNSAGKLAESIRAVFWDDGQQRFLVSTQPEQQRLAHTFYPEHVAQIFPLFVDFSLLSTDAASYYKRWMTEHRRLWLSQVHDDFAWGLVAVVALRQRDLASARCWLRETAKYRHSVHWTVTDEVASQILQQKNVRMAAPEEPCG